MKFHWLGKMIVQICLTTIILATISLNICKDEFPRKPEILGELYKNNYIRKIIGKIYPTSADSLNTKDEGSYCFPHHVVIKEERETTKVHIMFDGSAQINHQDYSINDCLHMRPNFIPKLLDHPYTIYISSNCTCS